VWLLASPLRPVSSAPNARLAIAELLLSNRPSTRPPSSLVYRRSRKTCGSRLVSLICKRGSRDSLEGAVPRRPKPSGTPREQALGRGSDIGSVAEGTARPDLPWSRESASLETQTGTALSGIHVSENVSERGAAKFHEFPRIRNRAIRRSFRNPRKREDLCSGGPDFAWNLLVGTPGFEPGTP
jgi:hypothetical protein